MEKWREWSDCGGDPESRFTKDELLTTVALYWATGTIGSSFGVYSDWALGSASVPHAWEGREEVPAAVALFDGGWPREWAKRSYADLRPFTEVPKGGHFATMEEPGLLAEDLRAFFRPLR